MISEPLKNIPLGSMLSAYFLTSGIFEAQKKKDEF